jgi:ATP synthase subunit 6
MFSSFFSPLEQFEVVPLFSIYLGFIDISITNELLIYLVLMFLLSTYIFSCLNPVDSTFNIVPTTWQLLIETISKVVSSIVVDNINFKDGQPYIPLVFSIFFFTASLNVIGLVPYSFTLTSHLIVTFALALFLFIGINIICVRHHGIEIFSLFLPSGTGVLLGLLLVPIESISYIFKPISLSIRLFANMMAGHTLLKVIAGFGWTLMGCSGVLFLLFQVPFFILIPLMCLELGVALIQSFVFSVLISIYLNEAIHLH